MKIAVVGGGIVGLTTALSLHRAGLRATVYEAVATPASLGVGINLLPHAVRELAELGLLEDVTRLGVPIGELVYRMADGREVWREPRGLAAGYDWPQIAIHRGRFHLYLLSRVSDALGEQSLKFGHALHALEPSERGATLHFVDRRTREAVATVDADVVIGADGIHSVVRRHFYPDEGIPKWNGISLYRGTARLPAEAVPPTMNWTGHSTQKFVGYPIAVDESRREVTFNWICDLPTGRPGDSPREDWNRVVDPNEWLGRYAGWTWPGIDVCDIVRRAEAVYEFPMVDRDPLPRWSCGRVTLAGDAAHPMYPIGSNGATQGIIDARSLAFHLASGDSPEDALARYDADRREATGRIVLMNRAHGPDRVLEEARCRAPTPITDLDQVFPLTERQRIADDYKVIAGFSPASLRSRRSYEPPSR